MSVDHSRECDINAADASESGLGDGPELCGASVSAGTAEGSRFRAGTWRIDWRVMLALGATYAFFGSGPAGAKAALMSFPPLLLVGVRGMVAGSILLGWSLLTGAQPPSRRQWAASGVIGILILALGAGCGTAGQRTVASGIAGVLSALLPLFAAGLGYVLFHEHLPRRGMIGLVIGFAGIGLLVRPGSNLDPFGVALLVAGQGSWALGAVLAPRFRLPHDPRTAAGAELLGGGAVLFIAAALLGDFGRLDLEAASLVSCCGLAWLILSAVVGFTAYGFLAKTVPCSVATTFSYVNPVVAIILGWLLFGEPVNLRMMIATAVIVAGVCLIVSARSETPPRLRHPLTSGHGHIIVVQGRHRSDRPRALSAQ